MFTGIVQAVGSVEDRRPVGRGVRFRVRAPELAERLAPGESVAVDGVCQTVVGRDGESFEFEAVRTTLARTTLGSWGSGRRVNLERPLAAGEPLGGHLVQGHVDGVARVVGLERAGETVLLRLRLPAGVPRVTVPRGSVAVDGVSLTVSALREDVAEIAVIPYTWRHTALPRLAPGEEVNVEADLIGKYVEKLLHPYGAGAGARFDPQGG